jgi:putative (di)nucleoside polyphosphate hydrolase
MIETYRNSIGSIIINSKKQIYVFQRADFPDCWQGAEGGVDAGETHEIAVYREILEEIGIDKKDLKFIAKASQGYRYKFPDGIPPKEGYVGQEKLFFLFEFVGNEADILKNPTGEKEFETWKIVDTSAEALKLVPVYKQDLYKKVFEEFKKYGI